ncbi:MAG: ester cyclase [Saprospiraceae bacterium]|nr:ester cyclase [Saprospiraceae bacterium]
MKTLFLSNLLQFGIMTVFLTACNEPNASESETTEARNIATVKSILAAMDAGETVKFDEFLTADYQIHNPFLPEPGNLEVFKGLMAGQKGSFPDVRHEVIQIFAKDNMVCVRGVFKGTNTEPMQNLPPTGNRVELPFIFTDEFTADGKLKVRHVQFDTGSFNAQLTKNPSAE